MSVAQTLGDVPSAIMNNLLYIFVAAVPDAACLQDVRRFIAVVTKVGPCHKMRKLGVTLDREEDFVKPAMAEEIKSGPGHEMDP
ncbi:hypothetical protein AUP74_02166 [Microbulbifer aggregans]|uniref:Uncharacterized protein n=1 Tax=Microbulbifer aggregans TaxID=1769779 RepID=A0A1C9W8X7_9GAMM|nr:hypothetical protein [Microbulbifer aggregans]AOS97582.1 hypothetical protein AUP74_02166 [Microbulbifer aggregans]